MKRITFAAPLLLGSLMLSTLAEAASFGISIGVRENGTAAPIFGNGGASGSIEWINRDGQTLTADGTWQLFTFTPSTDTLTGFAGLDANGILEADRGTIEHIRILNSDGTTDPFKIWIDDVTNTVAAGPVVENFDSAALGDEVMFQEPDFSGSTAGNIVAGGTSAVTDAMSFSGSQSLEVAAQFIDSTPTRWIRLTTFNSDIVPNPAVTFVEQGVPAPTISFWAKAVVIPEPTSLLLFSLAGCALVTTRRRVA